MSELLERRAIISGVGMSQTGRRIGRSGLDLALDAASRAIADAGLTIEAIDGIATIDAAEYSWNGTCHAASWIAPPLNSPFIMLTERYTSTCRHNPVATAMTAFTT